eukprot:1377320-Prorocentrum_lima.AAC.1
MEIQNWYERHSRSLESFSSDSDYVPSSDSDYAGPYSSILQSAFMDAEHHEDGEEEGEDLSDAGHHEGGEEEGEDLSETVTWRVS